MVVRHPPDPKLRPGRPDRCPCAAGTAGGVCRPLAAAGGTALGCWYWRAPCSASVWCAARCRRCSTPSGAPTPSWEAGAGLYAGTMRLRLCQLNYADLRRSPATWALHYCPVFVSAGACRPELPLFVWRGRAPAAAGAAAEMAQLPPDTRTDTTDRSMVFFLPAGIPLALLSDGYLTAVSRTTCRLLPCRCSSPPGCLPPCWALPPWAGTGRAYGQKGQLLLCRQHRFHLHQLCVFHRTPALLRCNPGR